MCNVRFNLFFVIQIFIKKMQTIGMIQDVAPYPWKQTHEHEIVFSSHGKTIPLNKFK